MQSTDTLRIIVQSQLSRAYSPYTKQFDVCLIEYSTEANSFDHCIGHTLENCAYPNSISAVHSAVVELRNRHRYDQKIGVTRVICNVYPNGKDLGILSDVVRFGDGVKLILVNGESFDFDSIIESMRQSGNFVHKPALADGMSYREGSRDVSKYQQFKYSGDEKLTSDDSYLCEKTFQAMMNSFPRTSNFAVGAGFLIEFDDGTCDIITAGNIEPTNICDTLCAERSALCVLYNKLATLKSAQKAIRITKGCVGLVSDSIASPCGACRQSLSEWGVFEMLLTRCDYESRSYTIVRRNTIARNDGTQDCLLPMAFTPSDLGLDHTPISYLSIVIHNSE